jgi:hypothetical protein
MNGGPRYRWQAAETLRQAEREAASQTLARAQRALADHQARAQAAGGELSSARALDLQRAAAFARRHAEVARTLSAALDRASGQVTALEAAVLREQAALASAHGGERAIASDRTRFERELRKQAEQREQGDLEEQRLGNPGGRKPL